MCQVSQTEHFSGEIPLRLCFCMQRVKHEHSVGPNKHSQLVEASHATTINTKHNEHDKLKESRTQSTQAVSCTTICIKLFSRIQHQSTYLEQLTRSILIKDQIFEHT